MDERPHGPSSTVRFRRHACRCMEADVPRGESLTPDAPRLARGLAWGSALSFPFWLAILAALIWL